MTDRITIHVCANDETLADGYIEDRQFYADSITEAVGDTCRLIDDKGYEAKCERWFKDWHGGKFSHGNNRIGQKIGGDVYGYRNGYVVTLEKNPSPELIAVVDAASDFLSEQIAAIGRLEDADRKEVAEQTEAD